MEWGAKISRFEDTVDLCESQAVAAGLGTSTVTITGAKGYGSITASSGHTFDAEDFS